MAIIHVDLENGNDANDGSTWALAKKTITSSPATGNEYHIAKTPDPVLSDITGSFTFLSDTVVLSAPVTKTIDTAIGNTWTSSANVTGGTYSIRKLGASCQQFSVLAAFTTGKIAYKTLASATDFSDYSKIFLWLQISTAIANNAGLRICLCSDTNGDVIVNEFILPNLTVTNNNYPVVLDNTTALGSAINSVAIYSTTDVAAYVVRINNIEACNDIDLNTLIGVETGIFKTWYCIQSIVGTTLILDQGGASCINNKGYNGTTGNYDIYYRTGVLVEALAISCPLHITFLFGYNTATDEVDGETFINNWRSSAKTVFSNYAAGVMTIKNLGIYRANTVFSTASYMTIENVNIICADTASNYIVRIQDARYINNFRISNCYVSSNNFDIVAIIYTAKEVKNLSILGCETRLGGYAMRISTAFGYYENITLSNIYNGLKIAALTPSVTMVLCTNNYVKNIIIEAVSGNESMVCIANKTIFDNLDFYDARGKYIYLQDTIIKNSRSLMDYNLSTLTFDVKETNETENIARQWNSSYMYCEWQTEIKRPGELGAWKLFKSPSFPFNPNVTNSLQTPMITIAEIAVEVGVEISILAYVYGVTNAGFFRISPLKCTVVDSELLVNAATGDTFAFRMTEITFTPIRTGIAVLEYTHELGNGTTYIAPIAIV